MIKSTLGSSAGHNIPAHPPRKDPVHGEFEMIETGVLVSFYNNNRPPRRYHVTDVDMLAELFAKELMLDKIGA